METIYKTKHKTINYLLYSLFITTAISPLFSYYLRVNGLHLIVISMMFFAMLLSLLKNDKLIPNRSFIYVYIYSCIIILGLLLGYNGISSFLQALSYRAIPPVLFLLFFSLSRTRNIGNEIGYNIIKLPNILCIVLAVFGVIERFNAQLIYRYYGDRLTTHLTLLIGGGVTRLISLAGNPINLGFYMTIGIGSALALIFINWKKSKLVVLIQAASIVLFIYIMLLTYSRSAILTTIIIFGSFLLLMQRQMTLVKKASIVIVLICLYFILTNIISNSSALQYRINTMTLDDFFQNARFQKASQAFDKDTSVFKLIFGHGIGKITTASSHVLELGYASLLYETGIVGLFIVIGFYIKAVFRAIKMIKKTKSYKDKCIYSFYASIIVSGLAGMFIMDLYMQQPYGIYLWFATFFLLLSTDPKLTHEYSKKINLGKIL